MTVTVLCPDLKAINATHRRTITPLAQRYFCAGCLDDWPCPTAQLSAYAAFVQEQHPKDLARARRQAATEAAPYDPETR